jgi:hypothetical protein
MKGRLHIINLCKYGIWSIFRAMLCICLYIKRMSKLYVIYRNMYIYIYVYIYTYIHVHIIIYQMCIHTYTHTHTYIYIHINFIQFQHLYPLIDGPKWSALNHSTKVYPANGQTKSPWFPAVLSRTRGCSSPQNIVQYCGPLRIPPPVTLW